MAIVEFTNKGIYCRQGNFYIDPWQPVNYAVTTHGHSDHVKWGNQYYLCHPLTALIIQQRISPDLNIQTLSYGEVLDKNGVKISFHPAGHIIGSSQVRLEYKGEVCVVSGDYKIEDDHLSAPFEVVKCHHFVSESTFGLPVYRWQKQELVLNAIRRWIENNIEENKTSILIAYGLGKAQRLMKHLQGDLPVYVHTSIANINDTLIEGGVQLPHAVRITPDISKDELQKGIVIVPPVMRDSKWIRTLQQPVKGVCSGWMQVRAHRRWQSADAGFALSDHADWSGLIEAVKSTGAEKVSVTHGFTAAFSRYLNENHMEAEEVITQYGSEEDPEEKKTDEDTNTLPQ